LIQQAAKISVGSLTGEIAEELVLDSIREILLSQQIEKRLKSLHRKSFSALPDGPHKHITTIPGMGARSRNSPWSPRPIPT
jgi:hypothetical protein